MNPAPDVTVIMPAYNPGPEIAAAVESVLTQRRVSLELIIVDDGSAAPVRQQVPGDQRVRIITHRHNRGYGAATNTGLAAAAGRWVVFVDADDRIEPGYLAGMCREGEEAGAQAVLAPLRTLGPGGQVGQLVWNPPAPVSTGPEAVAAVLQGRIAASQHCLLLRAALSVPAVETNAYSDIVFLCQNLLQQDTVACTDAALYTYTIHAESITGRLRPSVWDLAAVPELLQADVTAHFDERTSTALLAALRAQMLNQMLGKASREPSDSALRRAVFSYCRTQIGAGELWAALGSGQYTAAASLLLAVCSPALHRHVYRRREKRKTRTALHAQDALPA